MLRFSTYVSLPPSKIPYVGFSPVRLQTGRQARPSSTETCRTYTCPKPGSPLLWPFRAGLSDQIPVALQSRGPSLGRGLCCPSASNATMASSEPLIASRRLMISYVGSLPFGRLREVPHFILRVCVNVPPSVPRWTERLHLAVASPLVQAFALSARARHPYLHAHRFSRGCVSRLQSSLYAAAR